MGSGFMFVKNPRADSIGLTPSVPQQNPAQLALQASQTAEALFARGDFAAARDHFTRALDLQPDPLLHWKAAMCSWNLGHSGAAGYHLQKAVRMDPGFALAHSSLSGWFLLNGMVDHALEASSRAAAIAPDNATFSEWRAWALEAAGESPVAWDIVNQLLSRGYVTASVAHLYGRLARQFGEQEHALALVDRILTDQKISPVDEYKLNLTAADLLDSLGRYDEAFVHAACGNAVGRKRYNPEVHQRAFDKLIAYFTRDKLRSLSKARSCSAKPVFIVGMPRSGTSLVEQILASHSDVHGAGELDLLYQVVLGAAGMVGATESDYPGCLDRLTAEQAEGMAQIYLGPLEALNPTAGRITDKMPLNFIHLGIIATLLPGARIIHCRRDPLDTCLSNFMTPFVGRFEFKYDLRHLARFHGNYQRLMVHWKNVLDVPILDVTYEEVVADAPAQSRRMIEFLGLPWDEACLRFHENRRSVATSSVQQVRKPIYSSSIGRWRHYEKHLGSLKAALSKMNFR